MNRNDTLNPQKMQQGTLVWNADIAALWERLPATFQDPNPARKNTEGLLDALTEIGRRLRLGEEDVGAKIWIEGEASTLEASHFPTTDDTSLQAYLDRVNDLLWPKEFTILVADAHLYSPALWCEAKALAQELTDKVGMPTGGFDSCVFLGRYSKTPFGIHRGQMSVLTVPLVGRKAFWLWPYQYGLDHPEMQDSLEIDPYRKDALYRAAEPGELLYWPADYWHIAEADNQPTAAWNIGIWWDNTPRERTLQSLADTFMGFDAFDRKKHHTFSTGTGTAASLPKGITTAKAEIAALAEDPLFQDSLLINWLKFLSASGFRTPPPLLPIGQVGAKLDGTPMLFMERLSTGGLCVCANGHAAVFEDVSDDDRGRILEAVSTNTQPTAPHHLGQVFEFLAAAGAI